MENKQEDQSKKCTCGAAVAEPFIQAREDVFTPLDGDELFGEVGGVREEPGLRSETGEACRRNKGESSANGDDGSAEKMSVPMARQPAKEVEVATCAKRPNERGLQRKSRGKVADIPSKRGHALPIGASLVPAKGGPDNPFEESMSLDIKRKRVSSIKASDRIAKQIAFENACIKEKGKAGPHQALFCGLPSRRRALPLRLLCNGDGEKTMQPADSSAGKSSACIRPNALSSEISAARHDLAGEGSVLSSPAHKSFLNQEILKDKTNSPGKGVIAAKSSASRQNSRTREGCSAVGAFFLKDVEFLREKRKVSKSSKRYIKLKKRNTQYNQGYTTIIPRKKAVLDLFACPRAFFRRSTKQRTVHFDNSAPTTCHNSPGNVKSILLPDTREPPFKWEADKECIDIIRRVDLGSDISVEDFIFRRSDRSIES